MSSLDLSDQNISQLSLEHTTAMRSELLQNLGSPDPQRGLMTILPIQADLLVLATFRR